MKFNSLYLNICCSRLGDSKRNLWVGIFAFVGVVDGGVAAWGKLYDWRMCKNI